jgi:hypothetical protein
MISARASREIATSEGERPRAQRRGPRSSTAQTLKVAERSFGFQPEHFCHLLIDRKHSQSIDLLPRQSSGLSQ